MAAQHSIQGPFLGIDFSGAIGPWRSKVSRPTVWIAEADHQNGELVLLDLRSVQDLDGIGAPFDRLVALLARGEYAAAAIDAPFSIPGRYIPLGGWVDLVRGVGARPNGPGGRSFPEGAAVIEFAAAVADIQPRKQHYRACESHRRSQHLNVRSALWNGPRGGAPFTAACLALIHRSGRPCWPWVIGHRGLLVEAFPAAQLKNWKLPYQGYSKTHQEFVRREIVAAIRNRIRLTEEYANQMCISADALDAALAIFAAVAVASNLAVSPADNADEGWIAVHP